MGIAAIVFDMDGILVDSEKYWQAARVDFASSLGKDWTLDDQRQLMGSSTREWAIFMQKRLALEMSLDQIIDAIKDRLLPYYQHDLPIMPGAVEAVRLAADHFPIALASGSAPWAIDAIMRITGLGELFKIQVSADEVQHGKPAPDVFLEAARRMAVDPTHVVGIEDSSNGIRALKAAGMRAIAVPTEEVPLSAEILALSDAHLPSLKAFNLELLQRLS